MNKVFVAALALLCLGVNAQADVFNMGPGLTNLETVTVGDSGNVGELAGSGAGGVGPSRICGSVSYTYNIGKFEVSAAQYTDFLNHKAMSDPYGLYSADAYLSGIIRSSSPGNYIYSVSSAANAPVNCVSFWNACRFANWLHNGQGDGDTETGAYTLNGYNGFDGRNIVRNPGARWFIPSEDEWHKAAYYKGGGTQAGYWAYPTRSNSAPSNDLVTPDPGNNANFKLADGDYTIGGSPDCLTDVGEFENSESAYGTFDQAGNISEWIEDVTAVFDDTSSMRGIRGGDYGQASFRFRSAYRGSGTYPAISYAVGFRVAAAVPEPSSIIALAGGLVSLLGIRRRGT
ncbi:MAG: SUMF1/EgtB/PvdO family nonheme iron enzyme [Armatimonadetes bacterium]|nr:SUMF1/EgtB/PvdO family nonheme iron enzyme [Armatimonadota bacterium]